jgi:hypothetical protein
VWNVAAVGFCVWVLFLLASGDGLHLAAGFFAGVIYMQVDAALLAKGRLVTEKLRSKLKQYDGRD